MTADLERDLERLQAQARDAEQQAAAARAQLEQEQARRLEERERRQREFDERFVAEYDPARLATEEAEARQALVAAVLDQPWAQAWIGYRAARMRRQKLQLEWANMRRRLQLPEERMASIGPGETDLVAVIASVLERAAVEIRDAEQAAIYERRERHAAGEPGE